MQNDDVYDNWHSIDRKLKDGPPWIVACTFLDAIATLSIDENDAQAPTPNTHAFLQQKLTPESSSHNLTPTANRQLATAIWINDNCNGDLFVAH